MSKIAPDADWSLLRVAHDGQSNEPLNRVTPGNIGIFEDGGRGDAVEILRFLGASLIGDLARILRNNEPHELSIRVI
jgi:hypothetical protein